MDARAIAGTATLDRRDKAILTGIYLSKFGGDALAEFGFKTYTEAFNVLGYATGTRPSSVKLYRDEFDQLIPNGRHGWKRGVRPYCLHVLNAVEGASFGEFSNIIKAIVAGTPYIALPGSGTAKTTFSAQRLVTGEAAERYFMQNYRKITEFEGYECHDTTKAGCGFDFMLAKGNDSFCVEVKGLNERQGSVMMTEKEHDTALLVGAKYCLFVVSNFRQRPEHTLFFNPILNAKLAWQKEERTETIVTYNTKIFLKST